MSNTIETARALEQKASELKAAEFRQLLSEATLLRDDRNACSAAADRWRSMWHEADCRYARLAGFAIISSVSCFAIGLAIGHWWLR